MKVVKKKILPEYFRVVLARKKNFEIRVDEDNVQVGDLLIFGRVGWVLYGKQCKAAC